MRGEAHQDGIETVMIGEADDAAQVDTADEVIINCGSIVCVPCLDLHMLPAPGKTVCNLLRNTKSTIC